MTHFIEFLLYRTGGLHNPNDDLLLAFIEHINAVIIIIADFIQKPR